MTFINKFFPLLTIFSITFWCGITGKDKIGISLCAFFLPYNLFSIRELGFNIFAIMGLVSGYILRNLVAHNIIIKDLPYKKYIRLILFTFGLSVFIVLIRDDYSDVSWFGVTSIKSTSIGFIGTYISCLMLYVIISNTTKSLEELFSYITAFIASCYYLFLSWVGSFIYNLGLPDFLQMRHSEGNYYRFSGFWGDYELSNEYFFIVLILSLTLFWGKESKISQRVISLGTMIFSLPLAISTGTRSLIIMFTLFIIISFALYISRKQVSIVRKISFTFFSALLMISIYSLISRNYLFSKRVEQTLILIQMIQTRNVDVYSFEKIAGRNYSDTYQDILKVGNVVGIGPVFIYSVRGSTMVYHCLYYALIIHFGVIGLIIYLAFFTKLLKDLYGKYKLQNKILYMMLFCLFSTLLVDEIKINFMRQPSQMLIYWFLFSIIACANKLQYMSGKGEEKKLN